MAERRFLLVDAEVLPEVFVKVLQAKELLASGAVSNISAAAKQAGISRSAFYKYKDTVFDAETGRESITVVATLLDKTGALQSLLSGISAAGASIVTITQSRPENGAAQVEVTVRTGTMQMPVDEMLTRLSHQPCVVEIHAGRDRRGGRGMPRPRPSRKMPSGFRPRAGYARPLQSRYRV